MRVVQRTIAIREMKARRMREAADSRRWVALVFGGFYLPVVAMLFALIVASLTTFVYISGLKAIHRRQHSR